MVQTALDVCNLSIGRVGGETIDALDETTPAGAYCAIQYPQCRDWLLGKYRWAFATAIVQLAPRAITDVNCPRAYTYDFPADLVGAVSSYRTAADERAGYRACAEQVNGYIAADELPLFIEYTRRVPEAQWPVWFVELVKTVFATGLAASIAQSQGLAGQLMQIAFGSPAEMGEGGLYGQARNEDSRNAPQRQAFATWDDGALALARWGNGLWPGGIYSFPFVGLPGAPPTFINFPPGG